MVTGFTFIARQHRIQIDNDDFYLDLLFYNRKLKYLIAIDLKIGSIKPDYKGQMELDQSGIHVAEYLTAWMLSLTKLSEGRLNLPRSFSYPQGLQSIYASDTY